MWFDDKDFQFVDLLTKADDFTKTYKFINKNTLSYKNAKFFQ